MVRAALATAVNVVVWWGLLFLLYVILISDVPPLELMVGAGFALLGAVTAEAMRRAEHPAIRGSRRIVMAAAGFPLTLLHETAQLAAAVGRALFGRCGPGGFVTIRVPARTDAAVAAALLSASPGACVLDVVDAADGTAGGPDNPDAAASDGRPAGGAAGGIDLTAHVLGASVSRVERALGGRRVE